MLLVLRETLSLLRLYKKKVREHYFGRKYVNPFTGFILSSWFISPEVEALGLRHLNFASRRLNEAKAKKVRRGSYVFVQVDELETFIDEVLPKIQTRFVLITGKWGLPGLEWSPRLRALGEDDRIIMWFSQNQVFPQLKAMPFPYGLNFFSLEELDRATKRTHRQRGRTGLFVPFSRVHPHLTGDALKIRSELTPLMAPLTDINEYYANLREHRFVISPPGDRQDTYRHYECLALGAYPIGTVPSTFRQLFGENMIYCENLVEAVRHPNFIATKLPDLLFVRTKFWRKFVRNAILNC